MNQSKLFSGLKVIELASVLAGPSVGQFFAELGANVIKIENPKTNGDVTRSWKLTSEDISKNTSAYFAAFNWGKSHLFKNLKDKKDKKEVLELIKDADILIASYKPNDAEKLGFDYKSLKKINTTLIYGNISGYGSNDFRAGYDAVIQAETGYMYMNGNKNTPATKMPVALIDVLTAHQLKEGILASLYKKEKTGKGSYVEASLFDTGIASLGNQATNYLVANHIPQRIGSEHPNIAPYGTVFNTKDNKQIVLAVGNDKQFCNLCSILKIDIASKELYQDNHSRVKNRIELNHILTSEIIKSNRKALLEQLNAAKVPVGAVNNMKELFELESAQKMILEYADSDLKGIKNITFKIS